MSAMKTLFEENGIECLFVKGTNDKISCIYPAENAEQVAVLKNDYKAAHTSVETNCRITPDIPESESMSEIKLQIEELQSSLENAEKRGNFYAELSADKSIDYPEYSEKNMERVYEQMPEATRVADKAFWENQGYTLNENAIRICFVTPRRRFCLCKGCLSKRYRGALGIRRLLRPAIFMGIVSNPSTRSPRRLWGICFRGNERRPSNETSEPPQGDLRRFVFLLRLIYIYDKK